MLPLQPPRSEGAVLDRQCTPKAQKYLDTQHVNRVFMLGMVYMLYNVQVGLIQFIVRPQVCGASDQDTLSALATR